VKEIKLSDINAKSLKISGEVKVLNPNPYPIKVKRINADVFINNKKTGKAKLLERINIPSNSHGFIQAEIETEIEGGSLNLLPLVLQSAISGKTDIRLVGDMKAGTYIYGKKIPFDFTEKGEI
jgi:LEA14-like dessication related protein